MCGEEADLHVLPVTRVPAGRKHRALGVVAAQHEDGDLAVPAWRHLAGQQLLVQPFEVLLDRAGQPVARGHLEGLQHRAIRRGERVDLLGYVRWIA
ncbi:hypothetical protein D3C71_1135110 [compost metagenome]